MKGLISMINECFITPQVFNKEYDRCLFATLRDIKRYGVLLKIHHKHWVEIIGQYGIEERIRELLLNIKTININHKILTKEYFEEEQWCALIEKLKKLEEIDKSSIVVATKGQRMCKLPEELDLKRDKYFEIQNEEALRELSPILKHSQKITIIDPHLNLKLTRYKDALKLIYNLSTQSRTQERKKELIIHVKVPKYQNEITGPQDYFNKHNDIFSKWNNINFKFFIWDGELHSRLLSTDLCHLQMDDGINIQDDDHKKGALWTIIDDDTANRMKNKFDKAAKNKYKPIHMYENGNWYDWNSEEDDWKKISKK
ncbi:MAG: hypothetical protein QG567_2093 [Campylobacterota bacterium]|nr:hypothetical protein [Campylobacterota bacterium]